VSLSASLRMLKGRRLIETTLAVGACVDGDFAAVTVASALAWADGRGFDVVVCAIGPGIVGTASRFGNGAIAAAEAANTALALRAAPVLTARTSEVDERERHRGVSHHTRAVLELCLGRVAVAWPAGRPAPGWLEPREEIDTTGWREACEGLALSHMGRGPDDDPAFFETAFAAGSLARALAR
jgi:Protein of unknown function (DUF3866)